MKKSKKQIAFLIFAFIFSFGFVVVLRLLQKQNPFDITTLILGTTNLLTVLSIGYLFIKIIEVNSKRSVSYLRKRLIPTFLLSSLFTVFIVLSLFLLGNYLVFLIKDWDTFFFMREIGLSGGIISLSIGLIACCIVFFYAIWLQAVNREQKLREENLEYQYKNLKTQVNPHFLFNSLNTLSEIVYTDAKKADNFIQKLSAIYRYILDNEETDLISLNKELEFVRQYFDLQKERNGDKIELKLDIGNIDELKVIPVSLQILVENAIKHNSVSEKSPLKIEINKEPTYIVVSNNIQRKTILNNSSGTGLRNLEERIKLIMDKQLLVYEKNNQFIVKLPIVSMK